MTDQLETMLRETFDRTAEDAPPATDLAAGARARLRRRRVITRSSSAVAAAAALGTVLWVAAPGGTRVVPQPAPVATSDYCVASTDCEQQRTIDALRRPLRLPFATPGAACPVSPSVTLPKAGGFSTDYPAIGAGPFRLTGTGYVPFKDPPEAGSGYAGTGWPGQKVIWSIDASYAGPVLLRGGRIDDAGELRFDRYLGALGHRSGNTAYPELAYGANEGVPVVRTYPSAVRVQSEGCYAVQADGTTFSTVIVFRMVHDRSR